MSDSWPPAPKRNSAETPLAENLGPWRTFTTWLFLRTEAESHGWSTIWWWEKRRLAYNVFVGVTGFISLVLFELIMSAPGMLKLGEDAVEPFAILLMPIAVNICYTAGWILELLLFGRKPNPKVGPFLLKFGIGFSFFVICLPTVGACFRLLKL